MEDLKIRPESLKQLQEAVEYTLEQVSIYRECLPK
jgi:hypothetical protein